LWYVKNPVKNHFMASDFIKYNNFRNISPVVTMERLQQNVRIRFKK